MAMHKIDQKPNLNLPKLVTYLNPHKTKQN